MKAETTIQSDMHGNLTTASIGTSPLHAGYGSSPLTPSARISALNIVGDLLRKVGVSVRLFCLICLSFLLLKFTTAVTNLLIIINPGCEEN